MSGLDATGRAGEGSALERRPTGGLHFSAPTLDTAEGVVEGDFMTAPPGNRPSTRKRRTGPGSPGTGGGASGSPRQQRKR
ncbi:hypothetical protein ABZ612_32685 [Streptomyces avermitilis]|uniref:hypothetical protein n=1 Tax=Streptomyces avermitilis TaxID=33903 RepID=UPI0033CD2510